MNPVGAIPKGSALGAPRISHEVSTLGAGEGCRGGIRCPERLPCPVQRQFALGGAVGVVEGGLGVRRLAIVRRSSMVSALPSLRLRALSSGF